MFIYGVWTVLKHTVILKFRLNISKFCQVAKLIEIHSMASTEESYVANLALLEQKIRKDSSSYHDEFCQQVKHFRSTLLVFLNQPMQEGLRLSQLVNFISQIAQFYPNETKEFSEQLISLLRKQSVLLNSDLRLNLCRSLVLLRNKRLTSEIDIMKLFFDMFGLPDKVLRRYLLTSIIAQIKNVFMKCKNCKVDTMLKNFIFSKLHDDSNSITVRMALVVATAVKFFLGDDTNDNEIEDSDSEEETNSQTLKDVVLAYRVAKKSRKRFKQMEKAKSAISKHKKKKRVIQSGSVALYSLYDPQTFVERLFRRLETSTERYEFKLLLIGLIAKVTGLHKLLVLNFYSFLQRYLQPHQRDVTKLLLFAAQATHDLVPPDVIESLIRTICNNFITERNSAEVMTVGLNSVREICAQCPFAIETDLLQDLTEYKKYKNKNVTMAARSLIQLYRNADPSMLRRTDKGKPTEFIRELKPKHFGSQPSVSFVPGAECLLAQSKPDDQVSLTTHGSNADVMAESIESDSDISVDSDDGSVDVEESDTIMPSEEVRIVLNHTPNDGQQCDPVSRHQIAEMISCTRILSDKEHRKLQAYQMAKHILPAQTKLVARKRKLQETMDQLADDDHSDSDEGKSSLLPLTRLSDIEKLHKRPKQDKEARIQSIQDGRKGREKFGRPRKKHAMVGKTNAALTKKKPFSMVKHKQSYKRKRSFRDKQLALRRSLLAKRR